MDDVLAVMDAAGSESARRSAGTLEGGPMAALFAATFPERTTRSSSTPPSRAPPGRRTTSGPGPPRCATRTWTSCSTHWGEGWVAGVGGAEQAERPGLHGVGRAARAPGGEPATIRRIFDLIGGFDVRDVLPSIRVPTLVMHRTEDSFLKVEHSRYIASKIPGARYVELEGGDNMFSIGDSEACSARSRSSSPARATSASRTACSRPCMFTDICDSTQRAAEMGDRGWRFLLERHDALFRQALERHRGREVKRTGDGFLATFDGPARAIRCAASVAEAMGSLGLRGPRRASTRASSR